MNYDAIAFSIGNFSVYWYALFLAAGIISAVIVADLDVKRRKLFKDLSLDLCIVALPCGLLGARLLSCLINGRFTDFFKAEYPGMMLYGAIILAAVGIGIYAKIKKFSVLETLDCATPAMLTAIAIGRWGDLFQRTGYGPIIKAGWLKWIPIGMYNEQNEVCLSVFFLEFLVSIGLFLLIWLFIRKIKTIKGTVFFVGTGLYAFFAYFLEWLRADRADLWLLKTNQWFSVAIFIGILVYLILSKKLKPMVNFLLHPQYNIEPVEDVEEASIVEDGSAEEADGQEPDADEPIKTETETDTVDSEPDEGETEVAEDE